MGMNSVLQLYTPPPTTEKRTAANSTASYDVVITTSKLNGSPYHLYSVFYNSVEVLRLISNPGRDDIVNAVQRFLKLKESL